jgi:hypothetical protein
MTPLRYKLSTKDIVNNSKLCACFYCLQTYDASEVTEWVDRGFTAICPKCGIDSVVGDNGGTIPADWQLLEWHRESFNIGD